MNELKTELEKCESLCEVLSQRLDKMRQELDKDPESDNGIEGSFSHRLRMYRAQKSWSQSDLAKAAGLSFHAIHKLEQNRVHYPQARTIYALADALEIDPGKLQP